MGKTWVGVLFGFLIVGALLGGLELAVRRGLLGGAGRPAKRGEPRSLRELASDVSYWLLGPALIHPIVQFVVVSVIVLAALLAGAHLGGEGIRVFLASVAARSPVSKLPLPLQFLLGLALADLIAYWTHRAFHRVRRLWPFHAVHHSSARLDWLAAARVHPVNEVVSRAALSLPLVFLGFDWRVFGAAAPALTLYAILLHADVPWTFGSLRFVIASPRFHRWHHTSADEGLDRNFAGLFPIWDLLFGTFYMPAHEPTKFGVREDVPTTILGQLAYPFRTRAPEHPASAPGASTKDASPTAASAGGRRLPTQRIAS
ncbi:MAG: sterol desaturase family protein [Polyangiaceae bacterium]